MLILASYPELENDRRTIETSFFFKGTMSPGFCSLFAVTVLIINNYWMRLSMIARIIKAEVCVICRSRRLRRITQTEALIILAIMRKPNPIIVLLCIYLSKCSMCSLNKKYYPLFELLHKTALAHWQAFLSFEVHLLSFLSNIDEKLSVYIFIIKEFQIFC